MSEYIKQGYIDLNYIDGDSVSTVCDLSSLELELEKINTSLLALDEKINHLVRVINSFEPKVYHLTSLVEALVPQLLDLYLYGARKSDLSSLSINVDLSTLATKTDIATLSHVTLDDIVLPSLNGRGCEHLDGAMVTVLGRSDIVYTVERSFVSLYMDNGYTVHYDLIASSGHKVTVPEALLTKYTQTEV